MAQPSRGPVTRSAYYGQEAEARLSELGLTTEVFRQAVLIGDEQRQYCSPYHPKQAAGQRMWADTTAELRRATLSLDNGWTIATTDGLETAANERFGLEIAVVGGDEFTGHFGAREPRVKRRRGPVTSQRVENNLYVTEPLFAVPEADNAFSRQISTWFLLVRATDEVLYMELSLPVGVTNTGLVSTWSERIILPELNISGGVEPLPIDDGDDDGTFTVVRK